MLDGRVALRAFCEGHIETTNNRNYFAYLMVSIRARRALALLDHRIMHDIGIIMNRIESAFTNKPIFMPYFPLGYPDIETSIDVIEALAKNGADLIEVGLSFSDPLADGPVVQHATQIALEKGITVKKSIDAIRELRNRGVDIPLILMGYYNPMLAYGLERFVQNAKDAGADGFIIPDLPVEESDEFVRATGRSPLPLIRMIAPTSSSDRMEKIARDAKGFI